MADTNYYLLNTKDDFHFLIYNHFKDKTWQKNFNLISKEDVFNKINNYNLPTCIRIVVFKNHCRLCWFINPILLNKWKFVPIRIDKLKKEYRTKKLNRIL